MTCILMPENIDEFLAGLKDGFRVVEGNTTRFGEDE